MKESIVKMTYVGTPLIWQFDEVVKGKGCTVPESVITVEGVTYFISNDGFYAWSNGLQRIGEGKIDNFFLNSVNTGQYSYMSVASDPRAKIIYWNYASNDAVNGTPDKMLIYNYSVKEWTIADAGVDFIFNSVSLPWTIEQLDRYGTIENVPAPFDSPVWAGGNSYLAGINVAGAVFTFEGPNATGTIETSEQYLIQAFQAQNPNIQSERTTVMRARPMVDGSGTVMLSIGSRSLSQGDLVWSPISPRDPTTGWCNIRQQGRFHRARLTLTGNFSQATSMQFDAVPAGSR
jgi:hypothetical protein